MLESVQGIDKDVLHPSLRFRKMVMRAFLDSTIEMQQVQFPNEG